MKKKINKIGFDHLKVLFFIFHFLPSVVESSGSILNIDLSFKDNDIRGGWISGDLDISGEVQNSKSQTITIVWGNNPSNPLKAYRPIIELKIKSEKKIKKVVKIKNLKIPQGATHLIVYSTMNMNQQIKLNSLPILDLGVPNFKAQNLNFHQTAEKREGSKGRSEFFLRSTNGTLMLMPCTGDLQRMS